MLRRPAVAQHGVDVAKGGCEGTLIESRVLDRLPVAAAHDQDVARSRVVGIREVDLALSPHYSGEAVKGASEAAAEHEPLLPVVDDCDRLGVNSAVAGAETRDVARRQIAGGKDLLRQPYRVTADVCERSASEVRRKPDVHRPGEVEMERAHKLADISDGLGRQQREQPLMLGLEREDKRLPQQRARGGAVASTDSVSAALTHSGFSHRTALPASRALCVQRA